MVGKNRFVNFALVPPPENIAIGRYLQLPLSIGPKETSKQLRAQNRGIRYHREWQGGNRATSRHALDAFDLPMTRPLGRSYFSTLPAMDSGRMKSSLLKKGDSDNSAVRNPVMAKFVPSASARKMAVSIKKKTSSFTTKEFEQFSPEATKTNPKNEKSAMGVYWHEREAQVPTAKIVEQLSPTATKANSESKTLVNLSLPNRRIAQTMEVERSKASVRKEDPEQFPLKAKPKDKPPAKKGSPQKGIKAKLKYGSPSKKFPYLNNWTGDYPESFPPKATKTKSKGKKPGTEKFKHESELGSHLGRDKSSKDKVPSWRRPSSLLSGGSVAMHTTGRMQELPVIDTEVRQPISRAKSIVEFRKTADSLFEDLICTPNTNPPYTPLRYQIDTLSLLKRKILKDQSINKSWSYQLYRSNSRPVRVHYCKTFEMADHIAKLFMKDNVVGFDMEWLSRSIKSESPRYIDFIHMY